jgi:hypothetical protein
VDSADDRTAPAAAEASNNGAEQKCREIRNKVTDDIQPKGTSAVLHFSSFHDYFHSAARRCASQIAICVYEYDCDRIPAAAPETAGTRLLSSLPVHVTLPSAAALAPARVVRE